ILIAVLRNLDIRYPAVITDHIEVGIGTHEKRLTDDIILDRLIEGTVVYVNDCLVDLTDAGVVPVFKLAVGNGYPGRVERDTHELFAQVVSTGVPVAEH